MNHPEIFSCLNGISITHICDAHDEVRVISSSIKSLSEHHKMIGAAFTVKSHGDLLPVIKAINTAPPNSVIAIDTAGSEKAMAGEIFSTAAKKRGLSGIIIDGYCRDIDAIKKIKLPFFSKGISPRAGTKEKPGELQVDITCGNVNISPGEIIFSDENGIVVLSEKELEKVLSMAIEIKEREDKALNQIGLGANLYDVFNFENHYQKVLLGEKSKFDWTV